MKLKIIPAVEATVNEFLATPGIRVSRVQALENGHGASVYVFYEPQVSLEEQLQREAEQAQLRAAADAEKLRELRRVALWCKALADQADSADYMRLKNAGQRQKWLLAHGASTGDLADIMDLLTPEMLPVALKLASPEGSS